MERAKAVREEDKGRDDGIPRIKEVRDGCCLHKYTHSGPGKCYCFIYFQFGQVPNS